MNNFLVTNQSMFPHNCVPSIQWTREKEIEEKKKKWNCSMILSGQFAKIIQLHMWN